MISPQRAALSARVVPASSLFGCGQRLVSGVGGRADCEHTKKAFRLKWPTGSEATPMIRHPIESNFYVNVSEADVEVTFAPTRSQYTYSRLVEADLGLLSPSPLVRHAGRNGDTGDYEPQEVQAMAYRVALATARRLRKSAKPPAAGSK
jgi:hypothetical protein